LRAFSSNKKPEAAYFVAENGKRTGILILNINDASEIAAVAEPWFLALSATVEVTPVMLPEDLQEGGSRYRRGREEIQLENSRQNRQGASDARVTLGK